MNKSYWSGHLLLFDRKSATVYAPRAGTRLLIIFIIMEVILGPRLSLASWLGLPVPEAAIRVPALLILSLILVRIYAGIKFSQIGLYSWRVWSATERWYFIQTLILANGIFAMLLFPKLKLILNQPVLWSTAIDVLIVQLLWGFYQELIYRGVLQTELVRRWGTLAGILVTNTLFTFGPLHYYHWGAIGENPSHAWIFAAIFGIGLFFGFLFQRSGNLWMVGVFHGIGDWYLTGIPHVMSTN